MASWVPLGGTDPSGSVVPASDPPVPPFPPESPELGTSALASVVPPSLGAPPLPPVPPVPALPPVAPPAPPALPLLLSSLQAIRTRGRRAAATNAAFDTLRLAMLVSVFDIAARKPRCSGKAGATRH